MITTDELIQIKYYIKSCIKEELKEKNRMVEYLYAMCPRNIAKEIILKVENGYDPMSYVSEYVKWEKEKGTQNYGKVIIID